MIKRADVPDADFGSYAIEETTIEAMFDDAITEARNTATWPAVVKRPSCVVDRNALIKVAYRYRTDGDWKATIDLPNSAVLATIDRR